MIQALKTIAVVALVTIASYCSAWADSQEAFDTDVSKAYAAYRSAANYLRTGNPGIASLELSDAVDAWQYLEQKYASSPPEPYTTDDKFNATLGLVKKALIEGLAQAEDGDPKASLRTITPIREMIYDLRKRNGIRLYADCVTELNRAMEPIYVHRKIAPDLTDKAVKAQITDESQLYLSLLTDCQALAPEAYQKNSEFKHLFNGTMDSIQSMFPAIESGDPTRVVNVIRELRSFDRIIYFKFGG